jgi:hypothetical protein
VRLVARPASVAPATSGNSNSLHPRFVLRCRIQRCGDNMIHSTSIPHTIGATPLDFAAAARAILRLIHAIYAYVLFRSLRKAELRTRSSRDCTTSCRLFHDCYKNWIKKHFAECGTLTRIARSVSEPPFLLIFLHRSAGEIHTDMTLERLYLYRMSRQDAL